MAIRVGAFQVSRKPLDLFGDAIYTAENYERFFGLIIMHVDGQNKATNLADDRDQQWVERWMQTFY